MHHKFDLGSASVPTELSWGFLSLKSLAPLCKKSVSMVLGGEQKTINRDNLVIFLHAAANGIMSWTARFEMYQLPKEQEHFKKDVERIRARKIAFRLPEGKKFEPSMLAPRCMPPDWEHEAIQSRRSSEKWITHIFNNGRLALVAVYSLREPDDILADPLFNWLGENLRLNEKAWCVKPPKETKMPGLLPKLSDEPLGKDVQKEIQSSIERACAELKLDAKNISPDAAQKVIHQKLKELSASKRLKPDAQQNYAINLGSLWGQTICVALGWEWCAVKNGDAKIFSVASPNRSHFVQPLHFMQKQINKRGADAEITSLLLFNMLKAGDVPPTKAK